MMLWKRGIDIVAKDHAMCTGTPRGGGRGGHCQGARIYKGARAPTMSFFFFFFLKYLFILPSIARARMVCESVSTLWVTEVLYLSIILYKQNGLPSSLSQNSRIWVKFKEICHRHRLPARTQCYVTSVLIFVAISNHDTFVLMWRALFIWFIFFLFSCHRDTQIKDDLQEASILTVLLNCLQAEKPPK